MRLDDTFTSGNLTFTIVPDVYAAGREKVDAPMHDGTLGPSAISHVTNDLTIMIPRGQPRVPHPERSRPTGRASHHAEPRLRGCRSFLMQGLGDAGVTWRSEALFQEQIGHPLSHVDIPTAFESTATDGAALTAHPPHRAADLLWLRFLQSRTAFYIFER